METEEAQNKEIAKPSWVKIKKEELEKIIIEFAKKGETPAKIGLILRDKYGIPKTEIFGKKITKILKENKVNYKTEKDILEEKIRKLRKHIEKNKHDYTASRALTKKLWVVHSFEKKH